jgi:hypothetical protein
VGFVGGREEGRVGREGSELDYGDGRWEGKRCDVEAEGGDIQGVCGAGAGCEGESDGWDEYYDYERSGERAALRYDLVTDDMRKACSHAVLHSFHAEATHV